jgi:hypothetical protein
MMNVQLFYQLRFGNATPTAFESVAFPGFIGLAFPVRAIVGIEAAAPSWVTFTAHGNLMGLVKARLTAILLFARLDLVWLAIKFLLANRATKFYFGRWAAQPVSQLPASRATSTTKIMFTITTWRNLLFLAAPITFNNGRGELTFNAAINLTAPVSVPGCAFCRLAASGAMQNGANLLRLLGTLTGAIEPIFSLEWYKKKHLAALLTDKLNTFFCRFGQLLSGKFTTAGIGASEAAPVSDPVGFGEVLLTANGASSLYVHRDIISRYVNYAIIDSETVGCLLSSWDIARLRWWSQWPGWGQTDVDTILQVNEDSRQGRLF